MRSPRTILCVDDESVGLQVRRLMLERFGYSVLTAERGDTALLLFHERPADAVILDYYLPVVNGDVVAAAIRHMRPEVPIIMLSAFTTLPEGALNSVDAFLVKGLNPCRLLEILESLLQVRAAACRAS